MGALTERILESLVSLAARPYRLLYPDLFVEYSRKNVYVAMHRLQKNGFIEKQIIESEVCFKLTDLGLKEIERRKQKIKINGLRELKIADQNEWDGIWRVVVFDIPEKNKKVRNALRQTLKMLEFYQLQKSVWASKRNFTKEIRKWARELGLSEYIMVFETKEIS